MSLPCCDVIIPARNAAATLASAISSVLTQTAPNLRLFIVDDGSIDDTQAIARFFAVDDRRVRIIHQQGAGIAAAMNTGVAAGNSAFVARLDADDLSDPYRHARQISYLMEHPRVVAISGAHLEIRADGKGTGRMYCPPYVTQTNPRRAPAIEPSLTQPFMMVRREALVAAGGYRSFPVSEDSDLYWRLAEQGALVSLPEIVGSYRMHARSISTKSIENGRLIALCSQLAALSARRRATEQADITLPQHPRWRDAGNLADMIAQAAADTGLTPDEQRHLRLASAAKLMELAGYRPYELEACDCSFIARTLTLDICALAPDNRAELEKMRCASAARLLRKRQITNALKLASVSHMPQTLLQATKGRSYESKLYG
jgi:glycosyltransferase involved in cell wall biosynthesis